MAIRTNETNIKLTDEQLILHFQNGDVRHCIGGSVYFILGANGQGDIICKSDVVLLCDRDVIGVIFEKDGFI